VKVRLLSGSAASRLPPSGERAFKMSTLGQCSLGWRALSESPQEVHGSTMPKALHQHWSRSADGDWIRLHYLKVASGLTWYIADIQSCSTVTGYKEAKPADIPNSRLASTSTRETNLAPSAFSFPSRKHRGSCYTKAKAFGIRTDDIADVAALGGKILRIDWIED